MKTVITIVATDKKHTSIEGNAESINALRDLHDIGRAISWESDTIRISHNKSERSNLLAAIERINNPKPVKSVANAKHDRVMVEAGRYQPGDKINGRVITGLGKSWVANPDQYAQHNINPDVDYIQYAYFR
jgi:hypothetical protein